MEKNLIQKFTSENNCTINEIVLCAEDTKIEFLKNKKNSLITGTVTTAGTVVAFGSLVYFFGLPTNAEMKADIKNVYLHLIQANLLLATYGAGIGTYLVNNINKSKIETLNQLLTIAKKIQVLERLEGINQGETVSNDNSNIKNQKIKRFIKDYCNPKFNKSKSTKKSMIQLS